MKYVILKCPKSGKLTPFLGVDPVSHVELAVNNSTYGRAISAGFVQVFNGKCYTFGRSESLNLDYGLEDYQILAEAISNTLRTAKGQKPLFV